MKLALFKTPCYLNELECEVPDWEINFTPLDIFDGFDETSIVKEVKKKYGLKKIYSIKDFAEKINVYGNACVKMDDGQFYGLIDLDYNFDAASELLGVDLNSDFYKILQTIAIRYNRNETIDNILTTN